MPGRSGAGSASPSDKEPDPFLSLSGDEFETGLLDSMDELDQDTSAPAGAPTPSDTPPSPGSQDGSNLMIRDSDLPPLPDDISTDAENILKSHAESGEFEGFTMPEGADAIDEEFGDLDQVNLDDVDLSNEELTPPAPSAPPADIPEPTAPASGPVPNKGTSTSGSPGVPAGGADKSVEQQEMARFAASAPVDDDLLSSLATEIKTVKIEQNLSLLRDLKDFKAPATDIENELQAMSDQLSGIKKKLSPGSTEKT